MTSECAAEYRRWLNSPALTEAERQELRTLEGDEAEIESFTKAIERFANMQ